MSRSRTLLFVAALAVVASVCTPAPRSASAAATEGRVLRVASDVSYAPLEFYRGGSKTIVGFDYDLAQALGKHLGARIDFRNHDFDSIVKGLSAGQYDLVMSAMSDTRERERSVDFVDYFLSGTGMLTNAGNPAHLWDLASLCGHTVDVERGTSQEAALHKQQAACKNVGLGDITILAAPTDDAALKSFLSGKSSAHLSDYPVVAYLARTLHGGHAYRVIGRPFGVVPFGIAVAKTNHALRDQVQSALLAVVRDGTYDALLHKWNLEQGAIRSAPIDAGTKFQR